MNFIVEAFNMVKGFSLFNKCILIVATLFGYYLLNRFYRWKYSPNSTGFTALCIVFCSLTLLGTLALLTWYYHMHKAIPFYGGVFFVYCFYRTCSEIYYMYDIACRKFKVYNIKKDELINIRVKDNDIVTYRFLGKVSLEEKIYYVLVNEEQFEEDNDSNDKTLLADIFEMKFDEKCVCIDAIPVKDSDLATKVFNIYAKEATNE